MKLSVTSKQHQNQCPECHNYSQIFDYHNGNIICENCGLVIDSFAFDFGAEWRTFSPMDIKKKKRTGLPLSYCIFDKGLSTTIDWRDIDALGQKLSPSLSAQARRLRKWQIRTQIHSSTDRNLVYAMAELERLNSQLSLPATFRESAAKIYRKTLKMNLIKGRSIDAMIAASIYIICRQNKYPCKLDEIASKSRISFHDLGKSYRFILRKLNLSLPAIPVNQFISRYAHDLEISPQTQLNAEKILTHAKKYGITAGKDPSSLAAASIYVAAIKNGERKTQKQIAQVAQITEVTVRNRYKELVRCLHLKVN